MTGQQETETMAKSTDNNNDGNDNKDYNEE